MKPLSTFALGFAMLGFLVLFAQADDAKREVPKLEGKYALVGGKANGKPIDEDAKKATYTFTADEISIEGKGVKFLMGYKIDPTTTPMNIDMAISEGSEGTKGAVARGIVEVKGDLVKLAYTMEKDKRPKDFEGKEGNVFELKKVK